MLYTIALDVYIALVVTEMPKNSSLLHSSISDVFKTRCRITIPFPHRHHLFIHLVVSRDPRDIKRLPSTGTDRYPPHKRNLRGRIFESLAAEFLRSGILRALVSSLSSVRAAVRTRGEIFQRRTSTGTENHCVCGRLRGRATVMREMED